LEAENEKHRINDLRLYRILDTAAEKTFDDLTGLASVICGAPISLISLVDEHRQWFKSHHGLDVAETPRDQAFCDHAIRSDQIMVVEDAQADSRFANNPLVTGEPKIRFYAGAPLTVGSGTSLGTLCIIDREPRTLSDTQRQALGVLRDAVVSQLELRRAIYDLGALQKIIPMCAWCRNVRIEDPTTEDIVWQPLHEYVAKTSPVTHGICPVCKELEFKKLEE
jgi:GAF domain-containing protein